MLFLYQKRIYEYVIRQNAPYSDVSWRGFLLARDFSTNITAPLFERVAQRMLYVLSQNPAVSERTEDLFTRLTVERWKAVHMRGDEFPEGRKAGLIYEIFHTADKTIWYYLHLCILISDVIQVSFALYARRFFFRSPFSPLTSENNVYLVPFQIQKGEYM